MNQSTTILQRHIKSFMARTLPSGLAYVDSDLVYLFCNESYEASLGKSAAEIVGRPVADVVGQDYFETIRPYIDQAFAGAAVSFETSRLHEGRRSGVMIQLRPDVEPNGTVRGFGVVVTDVSSLIALKDELRSTKEAAVSANSAKDAFLANMSHEVRTPLGAVIGYSELLANSTLRPPERARFAAAIKRNGEILSNVISDILDLSQGNAARVEVERQCVPLKDVLTDIKTLLSLQAQDKGVALTLESDGPIPVELYTDARKLRQILLHVVGNAIKFTAKGSVNVSIRLIEGGPKTVLGFTVDDTGIGVGPADAARLFVPFSQVDASSKRVHGGNGLGLALSRRLARNLGGDVGLTSSRLGEGSTFLITIDPGSPDKRSTATFEIEAESATKMEPAKASLSRLEGLRVLLVEDSVDNQLLLGRFLRLAGATADTAQNGAEAVNMVHKKDYDLLLMDLQMPVMDGYEATALLRQEGYKTPIIALTAHSLKEERQRCLLAGFDDHLSKPIERAALVSYLSRYSVPQDG